MTASVLPGLGTTLAYSTDSGTTYTTVAQRVTIDGPGIEVGEADTTTLDTVTWKTSRPTLADPGEISGTCFYDPSDATHIEMFTLIAQPAIPWKLSFKISPTKTYTFTAWLKSFKPGGMEVKGNLSFDFSLRVTGAITSA